MNEDTAKHFNFSDAVLESISLEGRDIVMAVKNVFISRFSESLTGKRDVTVSGRYILYGAVTEKICAPSRPYIQPEPAAGNPFRRTRPPIRRKSEERLIYKNEYGKFLSSLSDSDILFVKHSGERKIKLGVSKDGTLYELDFDASEESFDIESSEPVKRSIREEAVYLNSLIPVVFSALSHKKTPPGAKLLCGAAAAYFLSPIDLIPDFIPGVGYLDDLLITPLLVSIAVRSIPADVFEECRETQVRKGRKKKLIYALPVIIFWVIVLIMLTALISGIIEAVTEVF